MAIIGGVSGQGIGAGAEAPGHCTSLSLTVGVNANNKKVLQVKWRDSSEGTWGSTAAVLKKGSISRTELDGTMIVTSNIKHIYMNTPFEYELPSNLTSGKYFVTLFPMTPTGIMNKVRASFASIDITV